MAKVNFKHSGIEVTIPSGTEFLEIYRKHPQLPLKFGCTQGDCGVCSIHVLEGSEQLTKKSDKERKTLKIKGLEGKNYRLACQCAINGDVILER